MMMSVLFSFAQKNDGGSSVLSLHGIKQVKTRVSISPVLGLYSANKHSASGAKQKLSAALSVKAEWRLTKHYQDFLLIGVEYMLHGVDFNSYYFYKDSLQLYSPSRMRYAYSLTIHELDFPILLKHSFQKESNTLFSQYIFAGYNYRWLIASRLNIADNGTELYNQNEKVIFKNGAFSPINSGFICFGAGFQKNIPAKEKAFFAEVQFKYGLNALYVHNDYSPSSLFLNNHFIYITVGSKF